MEKLNKKNFNVQPETHTVAVAEDSHSLISHFTSTVAQSDKSGTFWHPPNRF